MGGADVDAGVSTVDVLEDELSGLQAVPAVGEGVTQPVPGDLGRGVALAQAGEGDGVPLPGHQEPVGRLLRNLGRGWKEKRGEKKGVCFRNVLIKQARGI